MHKNLLLFYGILFIGLFFSSCEKKSCVDVICPGVNSTCIDGRCYCIAGYEGENCDILSYEKYIGSYQVSESCTTTFSGYVNQQFTSSITPGFRIDVISLNNFSNRGLAIDVSIIDATYLAISDQNIGAIDVSGGEGFYEVFNNRIRFEYSYTVSGNFHSCTAIYVKF
ncbi:MAG TPA: hypothetical protein VNJ07_13145 [Chitinophagales bacterium]|nr:hypothetical protein [Chitinophagales bacterium]